MPRCALHTLVGLLLGGVLLALLFGDVQGFHARMDFDRGSLEDFKDFYHPTGRRVLEDGSATPGFLYPPSFAVALAPLGRLPLETATALWLGLQLALVAALVALGLQLVRPGERLAGALVFLTLTSVPVAHNLHWGQVSVPIVTLVLLAACAERSGRPRAAVALVACAAAIKLYPLLFLLVPLLRGEGRRALGGALLAALLVVVAPALVIGPGDTVAFLREMGEALAERREAAFAAPNAQALGPTLARWAGAGGTWWSALGLLLAAAQLPFLRRASRTDPALAYLAVALCLPLLVEPHWPHYFAVLPVVQVLVLARGDGQARALALGSCALSSLVALRLFPDPEAYGGAGLLLVANLLLLVALRGLVAAAPEETAPAESRAAGPEGSGGEKVHPARAEA